MKGHAISVRYHLLTLLLALVFAVGAADARAGEPAKPMGAIFSLYQIKSFTGEITWPLDLYANARRGPKSTEGIMPLILESPAYLVGAGGGRQLTKAELDQLGQWIADGGTLLIAAGEGRKLFAGGCPAWLGRKEWKVSREVLTDDPPPMGPGLPPGDALEIATHPVTRGLNSAMVVKMTKGVKGKDGADHDRAQMVLRGAEGGQALVRQGNFVLVWLRKHGKGHIVYLGGELTPLRSRPAYLEHHIIYEMSAAGITVWRNLRDHLELPRRSTVISDWCRAAKRDAALWWRYEREKPNGGATCLPPVPNDGDILKEVRFDVGRGDRTWRELYFTTAAVHPALRMEATDLRGPDGARIPASAWRFYLHDFPRRFHWEMHDTPPLKGLRKAPYSLVPFNLAEPMDRDEVSLKGDRTHTFWLEFNCDDATPPGDYAGTLALKDGGKTVASVALSVKVWPLRKPDQSVLYFEFEHNWGSYPGGGFIYAGRKDAYGKRYDPETLAKFIRETPKLGISVGHFYGYFTMSYSSARAKLREDGRTVWALPIDDPDVFKREKLPALDFSFFDDAYFDVATEAGYRMFGTNYSLMPDHTLKYAKLVDPNAENGSPLHRRFATWYMTEMRRYLSERGFPTVLCKSMDEFGPEAAKAFVEDATITKAAGFRTLTTVPNCMWDATAAKTMDPVLDIWMGEMIAGDVFGMMTKRLGVTPNAGDQFWPYGASSVPGWTKDSAGLWPWIAAYQRYPLFHKHHFFRYYWIDTQPAMAGPDGFYLGMAAVQHARGIFNARYLASLLRMIDIAKAREDTRALAAEVEKDMRTIIGTSPDAILRIETQPSACAKRQGQEGIEKWVPYYTMSCDPADHERAKVEIFKRIVRLKDALKDVAPTVRYGATTLADNGKVACRVVSEFDASAAPLVTRLKALVGAAPPVTNEGAGKEALPTIIAGTREFAPIARFAEADLKERVTPLYPSANHYAIFVLGEGEKTSIVVVGGDEAGATKGVDRLSRLLTIENRW